MGGLYSDAVADQHADPNEHNKAAEQLYEFEQRLPAARGHPGARRRLMP